MSYYQGELFIKKTCTATGKTCFANKSDAEEVMARLNWSNRTAFNGKRVKHRMGKPELKRSYMCDHCGCYHLTSMQSPELKHNKNKRTLNPNAKLKKFKLY